MKKLIVLFSVIAFAICPFTPSTGNDRIPSSDGVEEIIFHISGEAGDIYRSPSVVPFTCYYYAQANMLVLYSSSISLDAFVTIEDTLNGGQNQQSVHICSVPTIIYLPSSSCYNIDIEIGEIIYSGYIS